MIAVELFCEYPGKDGITQTALIRAKCFSEAGIHLTKERVRKRFEKKYLKKGAPGIESFITMTTYDLWDDDGYYDNDTGWCYIARDNTVHYEID